MTRAAAIDIGSNSILLTIAEPNSPKAIPLKILFDEAQVTGLSKGLAAGDLITESAQERALKTLNFYRSKIDEFKPSLFKVVGTEAFRRAKNGEEVRKRLSAALKQEIELISGNQEAELSFWSVQKEHPEKNKAKVVFDIGGASTELCLGNDQGIQERVSLKVGSVTLTEKFSLQEGGDPTAADRFVKSLLNEVEWAKKSQTTIGVGVAGTFTSLIAIHFKLTSYSRDKVHGFSLSAEDVLRYRNLMLEMKLADRKQVLGLQADRADVFAGGMVIANAICEHFRWPQVMCMDAGIRFGVLYQLLNL